MERQSFSSSGKVEPAAYRIDIVSPQVFFCMREYVLEFFWLSSFWGKIPVGNRTTTMVLIVPQVTSQKFVEHILQFHAQYGDRLAIVPSDNPQEDWAGCIEYACASHVQTIPPYSLCRPPRKGPYLHFKRVLILSKVTNPQQERSPQ